MSLIPTTDATSMDTPTPQSLMSADGSIFDRVTGNLATFTPFPRLPIELRLIIWETAVAESAPRTIPIYEDPTRSIISSVKAPIITYIKCPAIFSVSQESRKVALKKYRNLAEENEEVCPVPIYFIPSMDLIHFVEDSETHYGKTAMSSPALEQFVSDLITSQIERLAIPFFDVFRQHKAYNLKFRRVRELLIVDRYGELPMHLLLDQVLLEDKTLQFNHDVGHYDMEEMRVAEGLVSYESRARSDFVKTGITLDNNALVEFVYEVFQKH